MHARATVALALGLLCGACGGGGGGGVHGGSSSSSSSGGGGSGSSSGGSSSGGSSSGGGAPAAADLLRFASAAEGSRASSGAYKLNEDDPSASVWMYARQGAVYWTADMDVDCDGKVTTECNANTDRSFYAGTSADDSHGQPLDAARVPFVVIPNKSALFDYQAAGLRLGSVVAVIFTRPGSAVPEVHYGPFADEGPAVSIGEASYAMVQLFGVSPDPNQGGVDDPLVTYVAFTGAGCVVSPIESAAAATEVGERCARAALGF